MGPEGSLAALFGQVEAGQIAIPAQTASFADDGTAEALSVVLGYAADNLPRTRMDIAPSLIQRVAEIAFCIVVYFVFFSPGSMVSIVLNSSILASRPINCVFGWKPECGSILCAVRTGYVLQTHITPVALVTSLLVQALKMPNYSVLWNVVLMMARGNV